jgi:hypothetical protein
MVMRGGKRPKRSDFISKTEEESGVLVPIPTRCANEETVNKFKNKQSDRIGLRRMDFGLKQLF